ncbi:hypothetical protein LX36DRAFT_650360 [Colletotrichum falcatum]|nr:hypothetical protein LX36DRAFT_650360 [Colletotrichum falcatum]
MASGTSSPRRSMAHINETQRWGRKTEFGLLLFSWIGLTMFAQDGGISGVGLDMVDTLGYADRRIPIKRRLQ